jgi:hypothetical protein
MERVKHTTLVHGITQTVSAKNYIISVGPDWDIHRDVVVFTVTYHGGQHGC